jgi:hypothetical protein
MTQIPRERFMKWDVLLSQQRLHSLCDCRVLQQPLWARRHRELRCLTLCGHLRPQQGNIPAADDAPLVQTAADYHDDLGTGTAREAARWGEGGRGWYAGEEASEGVCGLVTDAGTAVATVGEHPSAYAAAGGDRVEAARA